MSVQEMKPIKEGKVREIYDNGDTLIMVATDRISCFGYLVFRSEDNSDMVECFKSHVLAFYEEAKISSLSNEAFKD